MPDLFSVISVQRCASGQRNLKSLASVLQPELNSIVEAGTWKNERIIASSQSTEIKLSDGKKVLNFCANNYLGLSVSIITI